MIADQINKMVIRLIKHVPLLLGMLIGAYGVAHYFIPFKLQNLEEQNKYLLSKVQEDGNNKKYLDNLITVLNKDKKELSQKILRLEGEIKMHETKKERPYLVYEETIFEQEAKDIFEGGLILLASQIDPLKQTASVEIRPITNEANIVSYHWDNLNPSVSKNFKFRNKDYCFIINSIEKYVTKNKSGLTYSIVDLTKCKLSHSINN